LAVACNLGAEPVQVPITGEVVLCSASPSVGANTAEIQPYSFAILRAVDS
jgi:maltooligosyltrehalose trehalohydrolase